MNSVDTNDILNTLAVFHNRSLASYLRYAVPWNVKSGNAKATLDAIVEDHARTVDRLAQMILENNGDVRAGEYPMTFTSLHDLSIDYLVQKLIGEQNRLIERIEHCTEQLATAPMTRELAEEALGLAKGHLQALEELAAELEA